MKVSLASPRTITNGSIPTATMAGGLRYEARVSKWFEEQGYNFHPQVEFEMTSGGLFRPDGLLFSADFGQLVVVEVKTQESQAAHAQLAKYQRRVSVWFGRPVKGLLVCMSAYPYNMAIVPHVKCVFDESQPFDQMVLTLAARNLPRLRGAEGGGLGLAAGAAPYPVRADGGVRDGSGCSSRAVILAASPGAD